MSSCIAEDDTLSIAKINIFISLKNFDHK